jgi:hypothetical protein
MSENIRLPDVPSGPLPAITPRTLVELIACARGEAHRGDAYSTLAALTRHQGRTEAMLALGQIESLLAMVQEPDRGLGTYQNAVVVLESVDGLRARRIPLRWLARFAAAIADEEEAEGLDVS